MRRFYFIIAAAFRLIGCVSTHMASLHIKSPMRVVIDGQSNAMYLPKEYIMCALLLHGIAADSVINIAGSGTSLRQHMKIGDPWANTITPQPNIYAVALTDIKKAAPQLYIWWQGEFEAGYDHGSQTYASDFRNFITDLREQAGHFIVVYVKLSAQSGCTKALSEMREQQDSLMSIPNVYRVTIDDLKPPDGLHYTDAQYRIVASRIASVFASNRRRGSE